MGVKGLSSWVFTNCPSLGTLVTPSKLIIDGNSFIHHLLHDAPDHVVMRLKLIQFISKLQDSDCSAIIVFDGLRPDSKTLTRVGRCQQLIYTLSDALTGRRRYGKPNPGLSPIIIPCCVQTFQSYNIPVHLSTQEADLEIAQLAREHDAFVVSNDSDFYILDTPGFIHLSHFSWKQSPTVQGKMVTRSMIANALNIKLHLLPLFAVLVGCDYSPPSMHMDMAIAGLRGIDLEMEKVVRSMVHDSKEEERLLLAVQGYDLDSKPASMSRFQGVNEACVQGYYHPHLLQIELNSVFWCKPFMQDMQQASAWDVSAIVRRHVYGLMGQGKCKEYIRKGNTFLGIDVYGTHFPKAPDRTWESFYALLDSSVLSNHELPMHYLPWTLAIRLLIQESFKMRRPIRDYEVSALVCAGILSHSFYKSETVPSTPSTPSRRSLHLQAQMETLLFCLFLLDQSLLRLPNSFKADSLARDAFFWEALDPKMIYKCVQMTRGGAQSDRILASDSHRKDYLILVKAVLDGGNWEKIEDVVGSFSI